MRKFQFFLKYVVTTLPGQIRNRYCNILPVRSWHRGHNWGESESSHLAVSSHHSDCWPNAVIYAYFTCFICSVSGTAVNAVIIVIRISDSKGSDRGQSLTCPLG